MRWSKSKWLHLNDGYDRCDVSTKVIGMTGMIIVLSPNLRRGLTQNYAAKSGILGSLILFCRLF